MTREEAEKLVQETAAKLGEHFDAVQILASFNEEAESNGLFHGTGNWYARIGMAREFVLFDEGQIRAKSARDYNNRCDDSDS